MWEQLVVEPIVPNGAQSINLVSEMEQESERNQIWVELDAVNLHEVYYYKYITIYSYNVMYVLALSQRCFQ